MRPQASEGEAQHGIFRRARRFGQGHERLRCGWYGKIVREVKVASEPEALLKVLRDAGYHFKLIGLEARPLSQWLFSALTEADTVATTVFVILRLIRYGGPALCNMAVTNSCNATCDFCNFAYDKGHVGKLKWIDANVFDRALDILYQRNIRYVSFFGGETLLHPRLHDMIAMVVAKNMEPAVITNGWLLPTKLDKLAKAGLKTVYVAIDSARLEEHESNRGLRGLEQRIRAANSRMHSLGMTSFAQVTINKIDRRL